MNVSAYVLQRLREWGVTEVFGYPGDGINGLVAAFGEADNQPRFVQSRHEEMSALQAVGYAKFSGRPGVCMATSGPGAIHLLNGLYDAKLDHVPVVAIVGQTARTAMGGSYQQEVDLNSLFKDVASAFVQTAMVSAQLPNLIDRAFRIAMAERAPTCVIIPADLQEESYTPPQHAFRHVPSSPPGFVQAVTCAPSADLERAADVINSGSKLAILVGQGARGASAEVMELALRTGAGVAKALLGKDVLSDELPYVTGAIGLLGSRPSYELMRDCDTLLIVGSNFPYSQFLPDFDDARAVQIDVDGRLMGLRYPIEVPLIGDAATTLQALLPLIERKDDRSWEQIVHKNVSRWWNTVEKQAHVPAEPVNPMLLFWELSSRLPENAIVTADSGSAANWYARDLRFHGRIRGSLSGTLATMGAAVPYAIGAKFAHPSRPAIAFAGDGAMQMNGLAELITIRRYFPLWDDPRLVVAVLHNNDLNQVTWELRAMGGSPKFEESQTLPDVPYAAFARSIGLDGIEVDKPDQIAPAWDRALAADRPVILDVRCDPNIPPIPPHADFAQLKDAAEAIIKGDPDSFGIVTKGLRTKAQELLGRS